MFPACTHKCPLGVFHPMCVCVHVCMSLCMCLFESLRLRGVERRGHTEPVTKLIRQIPVTWVTFSQLRSSAHTMWTSLLFLSFVCFLFASFPPLSGFRPMDFFWLLYSTCSEIFMLCIKLKGQSLSKQEVKWEHIHMDQARSKQRDFLVEFVSDTPHLYAKNKIQYLILTLYCI